MSKNEYLIANAMKNEKLFPTFLKEEKGKNFIITMPFYKSQKINYKEKISFVKDYIKSLLLAIKKLNEKRYTHGDIKPNNFLYNNKEEYWLIDFDSSYNATISASYSSTFPFIPPEKNSFVYIEKKFNFKSDLWTVGIILLFFMAKKKLFKKINISGKKNQNLNSLLIYITLYDIKKLNLNVDTNILIKNTNLNIKQIL